MVSKFEIGMPNRILIENQKHFVEFVNKMNGKVNLYRTVYNFDDVNGYSVNYNSAIINKTFFDFDGLESGYKEIVKLHKWCVKHDIKHSLFFSGGGFHCYIYTTGVIRNDKKATLKTLNTFIENNALVKNDPAVVGDIARISRVPNTFNLRRKRYCIPLTKEDLEKGLNHILEKSKNQHFVNPTIHGKLLDTTPYDTEARSCEKNDAEFVNANTQDINILPSCVQAMLLKPHLVKNKHRFYYALACRELSLSPEECNAIAKKHWSNTMDSTGTKTKYEEFCEEKQIHFAYETDKLFPSCMTLKEFCPGKCSKKVYHE